MPPHARHTLPQTGTGAPPEFSSLPPPNSNKADSSSQLEVSDAYFKVCGLGCGVAWLAPQHSTFGTSWLCGKLLALALAETLPFPAAGIVPGGPSASSNLMPAVLPKTVAATAGMISSVFLCWWRCGGPPAPSFDLSTYAAIQHEQGLSTQVGPDEGWLHLG